MESTNLAPLVGDLVPRSSFVRGPLRRITARLLGFEAAEQLYNAIRSAPGEKPITERVLEHLSITYRAGDRDLKEIPRTGPTVIVANHPFGVLEGIVLATILRNIRPDVRILANRLLGRIPEVRDLLFPVDVLGGTAHDNLASLRRSIQFLREGGCLVVFPAGEVSRFELRAHKIIDPSWDTSVVRMIEALSRNKIAVNTVPVYIRGANSLAFYVAGAIHPQIRTALLARELLNKKNSLIEIRIGRPINSTKLLAIPNAKDRTEYLRWRTYLLADRHEYKPRVSLPLLNRSRRPAPKEVRGEASQEVLALEIAALSSEHFLSKTGDLDIVAAAAYLVPTCVEEIGRLRETTFRLAGEGTGNSTDLDRFDTTYVHLFAWNRVKCEIVGAYRLAGTDAIRDLYTATLFKYNDKFLERLGPALELGRSFIRPEYQRTLAPLLALWRGIGVYVSRNPRYKTLFGPVSISNQYQSVSRELMVNFLERYASLREWAELVVQRNPLRRRRSNAPVPPTGLDIEDLSDCVADLEPTRTGIPILLRHYLKLGGKLLGFNVDPEFSNVLDGLIIVDLTQTEPRLLERYLGKAETAKFLKYHRGDHET